MDATDARNVELPAGARSLQDVGRCLACQHWQGRVSEEYTPEKPDDDWTWNKCQVLKGVLEIELRTGWDGGYVDYIETPANFGCKLWEAKASTDRTHLPR